RLAFAFSVLSSAGSLVPLAPDQVDVDPSRPGLALLKPAFVRSLPGNAITTFGVRVTDPVNVGTATASVLLQNGRPIAVGDPPRTWRAGGEPWAPGASFPVTLSCAASAEPVGLALEAVDTLHGAPDGDFGDFNDFAALAHVATGNEIVASIDVDPAAAPNLELRTFDWPSGAQRAALPLGQDNIAGVVIP